MQTLFHESKNTLFTLLCQISNEIQSGRQRTEQDILAQLKKEFLGYEPDIRREKELLHTIFEYESSTDPVRLRLEHSATIPFLPTQLELSWLKNMLEDTQAAFLLSPKLHKKLQQQLKDIPLLHTNEHWKKLRRTEDDTTAEPLQHHLRTLQQALCQNVQIRYINRDATGQIHKGTAIPYRLEYDLSDDKYRLIIWNNEQNRAIKVTLANLIELQLSQEKIPADVYISITKFYETRKTSLTLRLTPKANAVERCFFLFSPYDKDTWLDGENDFLFRISFYDFDRQEIIDKILSLGAAVTVLEPVDIRKEIIEKLQAAYQKYLTAPNEELLP